MHNPVQYDYTGWQLADRYEFIRVLGTGGTGTVYLAKDLLLNRKVAVKTVLPALADNLEIRRRIDHECRLHAAIGVHPHIVTLYDKLEVDGRMYLVMEYVRGEVLADILNGTRRKDSVQLSVDETISLVRQVLLAISCIHKHGILHRDIKTSNIIVQRQAAGEHQVKLMDFGIARLNGSEDAITRLTQLSNTGPGTPTYMAPERIDPKKYGESSPATDLYSVGVILYQLLSDGPPFRGTITDIFNGHLFQQVDLSRLGGEVSSEIRDIIEKALAKEPKKRFADAMSFISALNRESISHPPLPAEGLQGNDLTLPVIESVGHLSVESTLLAPEPKVLATSLPGPQKNNRYLIGIMVASLCILVFFFSVHLFFSEKKKNMSSAEVVAGTDSDQALITGNQEPEVSALELLQDDDGERTSALDVLQVSRRPGQPPAVGSTLENRLMDNKPVVGDPDWKILERNVERIDK